MTLIFIVDGASAAATRYALVDALEHRGATGQNNVRVEVLADIHVALHDGLEGRVMDAAGLLADEARVEEHLRATACDGGTSLA